MQNERNEILLQRRADRGTWGLVGGCIELGESSTETLIREFFEETGIIVCPQKLLNIYTNFKETYPNGDIAQTIGFIYEVNTMGLVEIDNFQNEETLELSFYSYDDRS